MAFGKYVEVQLFHEGQPEHWFFSTVTLQTNTDVIGQPQSNRLRVDFEIYEMSLYSKAKVTIYNISDETATAIAKEGNQFKLWVGLHGGPLQQVGGRMYLSNSLFVKRVPENTVTLFGFSTLKQDFLDVILKGNPVPKNTTLKDLIIHLCERSADISLKPKVSIKFSDTWPEALLNKKIPTAYSLEKSLSYNLKTLGRIYGFTYFTQADDLLFTFIPKNSDAESSIPLRDLIPVVEIDVRNLRANPVVSIGKLSATVNLEPNIKTADIISTNGFVTSAGGETDVAMQHANRIVEIGRSFDKYQVVDVTHKGSTHNNIWETVFVAVGPSTTGEREQVTKDNVWLKGG